jgi:lipopolysaccharide/colanic/teichoic acid biosynthesis glycosyltransferase
VIKRLFDIVISAMALVALSPLLLIIALFVKLDSPGPVFFRQRRLGKGARPFEIYKFRTMVAGGETNGSAITLKNDARVTPLGKMLRRFDLDELPTLYNVLKGDMSIVGPRPEVPEYFAYYSDEQKQIFSVRPGLTDPGTLAFRNEATLLVGQNPEEIYIGQILPHKVALSLGYVKKQSFLHDMDILAKTLLAVLTQRKG